MYLPKEEQRYGRNKETVVNHSYLESGEYRKKFDRISNDAELNKLLYRLAKRMLIHRSGTLYEDMYWIDRDSLYIVAAETNGDVEQKIVYSMSTRKAVQGKKGLLTIHSHPNSMPPSLEDFNSNFMHGNGMGIVCCHDGKIFRYEARELVSEETYYFFERKYFTEYRDEYVAQRKTWDELTKLYKVNLEEV